jgi:hypothetical protein
VKPEEAEQDVKLMEMVRQQTDQWTQLMQAQRRARWDLTKGGHTCTLSKPYRITVSQAISRPQFFVN